MRLTANKAEVMYVKLDRCRRTVTNVKNDLRAMQPHAKGGDLSAIVGMMGAIVAAEAACEDAATLLEATTQRMARIESAKREARA